MCADTAIRSNLGVAMAVIMAGGASLGWIGNKAVDYTFSDVRQNTEARIELTSEISHLKEEVMDLKTALASFAVIKDMVVRIDERTQKWEPVR